MSDNLITLPTTSGVIEQQYLIEALGGTRSPTQYVDRFPDDLYSKAPESHLIRFLYALLGPSGVGQLHENYLRARLALEDHGLEGFDLEAFFGSPFKFGRILNELYESDPSGVLTQEEWDLIRARDSRYRSRAIDFFNGARAGTSPEGMRLVARAGLGHDVEIIENYRYLFDAHSDAPLGLDYFGKTESTEEMIVVPRRETSQSEVQQINIDADGGYFQLEFRGAVTGAIDWTDPDVDAQASLVQEALEALPTIGIGNVVVTGGPSLVDTTLFVAPYLVLFTRDLATTDVPLLGVINSLGGDAVATVTTATNGVDSASEVVNITAADQHALQVAIDRTRPVTAIPTTYAGAGLRRRQSWNAVSASSESIEVLRYVTGQPAVDWPEVNGPYWIERDIEKQGPRLIQNLDRNYCGFHSVAGVNASSSHLGLFSATQRQYFSHLRPFDDDVLVFGGDRAPADYPDPLTVTAPTTIQSIYPIQYSGLAGTPEIKYREEQFWASEEAATGEEVLTLDLGEVKAINYLAFEISGKPIDISIEYDASGFAEGQWWEVTPEANGLFADEVSYQAAAFNPWVLSEFHFTDAVGQQIFARYIRVRFARRTDVAPLPEGIEYSVEVRNLRLGRNVSA